jgi:hypothetical protein
MVHPSWCGFCRQPDSLSCCAILTEVWRGQLQYPAEVSLIRCLPYSHRETVYRTWSHFPSLFEVLGLY